MKEQRLFSLSSWGAAALGPAALGHGQAVQRGKCRFGSQTTAQVPSHPSHTAMMNSDRIYLTGLS